MQLLETALHVPDGDKAHWTIGELAEAFGLTLRTLRYYEDIGLLTPRREGARRLYTRGDHGRLQLICRGKRLGFTLNEIEDFLALYDSDPVQEAQMRFLKDKARLRRRQLEQQKRDLELTLAEIADIEQAIDAHLRRQGHDLTTNTKD